MYVFSLTVCSSRAFSADPFIDRSQVYPRCLEWTTFPITSLLEILWDSQQAALQNNQAISPYLVELASVLERTLNVAHTGNVAVIATTLMDPLYVGRSLVDHGSPTFHECLKITQLPKSSVSVPEHRWPRHMETREPFVASRRSQIFNYGIAHWEVRISHLLINYHSCAYRRLYCYLFLIPFLRYIVRKSVVPGFR